MKERRKNRILKVLAIGFVLVLSFAAFCYAEDEEMTPTQASKVLLAGIENHDTEIKLRVATENQDAAKVTDYIFNNAIATCDIGDYYYYSVYDGYTIYYSYYRQYGVTHYTFNYHMDYRTSAAQERAFEKKLAKVMKSLKLKGKSDYKKAHTIYKYITKNVKYARKSKTDLKFSAYYALVKKKAVCQGYAALYYRMCKEAGLQCRLITGTSMGENHAWNIVKIKNKYYYNIDSTWDAGRKSFQYFLKCNKKFKKHNRAAKFKTPAFNKKHPMSKKNYKL